MRVRHPSALAVAPLAAVALAACGGGGPSGAGQEGHQSGAADRAFLRAMVPHHRSAIEMAEVARTEARTQFVRDLAADIVRSQNAEIARMGRIHQRLFDRPLVPDMNAHSGLGLSAEQAGMQHMDGGAGLRGQRPFDRAFVDEMAPHHQGAIRMGEAVLVKTQDPEVRRLAREIIVAQRREIAQMNAFRQREYGTPAPVAGGQTG